MMLKKVSLLLIPLCFTVCAYAGDMGTLSHNYFISVSAGPGWTNAGTAQTIALQPDVIKTYVPDNLSNATILGSGEVFFGLQKSFFQNIQSQFGLAIYASSPATLNGFIQEDGDPNFQDFSYQYQVGHEHIALKSKWIFDNSFNVNPYLSASIGVGMNHSYGYTITPIIFQAFTAPPFKSKTQAALSYSFGAGLQHAVNQHINIGLGYQLVSWGSNNLNPAEGQTSSKGLGLNTLYTQNIEFNISYLL